MTVTHPFSTDNSVTFQAPPPCGCTYLESSRFRTHLGCAWAVAQCGGQTQILVDQGRATFSEQGPGPAPAAGPDETFRSSSWAGVTNENPKRPIYYNTSSSSSDCCAGQRSTPHSHTSFYCKAAKSMRRLVLLAMKKSVNVRLDG